MRGFLLTFTALNMVTPLSDGDGRIVWPGEMERAIPVAVGLRVSCVFWRDKQTTNGFMGVLVSGECVVLCVKLDTVLFVCLLAAGIGPH